MKNIPQILIVSIYAIFAGKIKSFLNDFKRSNLIL